MKGEISKEAIQKFNRDGAIFTVLLILTVIAAVPLAVFFRILWIYRLGNSFLNYDILRFKSRKVQKRK